MTLFVLSVALVLAVSAACSLMEAALHAVRTPFVRTLAESGSRSGQLLSNFKDNMEQPIFAILVINTIANTAGAAVAGAQAVLLFGEPALLWFSVGFTLTVLCFAEIVPKVVGVAYSRPVARALASPLATLVMLLYPLIRFIQLASGALKPRQKESAASEEEVTQMAVISAEEGSIMPYEAELVRNVLHLNDLTTREIMTPRPVVQKLPSNKTLSEVAEHVQQWTYSRIPVYAARDPETWLGFVLSREVLKALSQGRLDERVESLCKPMFFVSEKTPGHVLLRAFIKRRTHLFGVADEYGDLTGIVTLEDVLESLIGEEIVDELDMAVDMQEVARMRERKHGRRMAIRDTDSDNLESND